MSDHAKLSITFTGTDQPPWVVFHPDSVDEGGYMVQEARAKGLFAKVREIQAEYASGAVSTTQAVANVQAAMPGAQVVSSDDGMWAGMNTQPQYQGPPQQGPIANMPGQFAANGQAIQQGYQQQQYQQQAPPQQQLPPGTTPTCAHGPREYVAQGKYGPFWACPQPKGAPDKCKAVNAGR